MNSVYTALENDLRVLAAIGMRTAFDRVSELVGIDIEKPFAEKLKQLRYEGHIGAADKHKLDALIKAGSASVHRGWEQEQLEVLTSIMEHCVESILLHAEAGKLKQSIPPRYKQRPPDNRETSQLIEFPSRKPPKNPD